MIFGSFFRLKILSCAHAALLETAMRKRNSPVLCGNCRNLAVRVGTDEATDLFGSPGMIRRELTR
jgi:hypothetical protein